MRRSSEPGLGPDSDIAQPLGVMTLSSTSLSHLTIHQWRLGELVRPHPPTRPSQSVPAMSPLADAPQRLDQGVHCRGLRIEELVVPHPL
jgi:hypothetical protein